MCYFFANIGFYRGWLYRQANINFYNGMLITSLVQFSVTLKLIDDVPSNELNL